MIVKDFMDRYRLRTAVKEALDTLPSAVCYFTPDGNIKLCNTAMYALFRKMTGRDLQSLGELQDALKDCGSTDGIVREGNVFRFPDGSAWKYGSGEVRTADGRTYIEAVFSDVTELSGKRRELREQSAELKKMYGELKTLSDNVLEMTREQEILNLKTRLHDQMNMGVAAIRQILRQNAATEENAAAVRQFRRAIQVLQEENEEPEGDVAEFIRDAEVSGIRVEITGTLPESGKQKNLLLPVLRESCVNAVRHADASVLYITAEVTEGAVRLKITNDGKQPETEIAPRGGLADLKRRITAAGGNFEIESMPRFRMTVTLPAEADGRGSGNDQSPCDR